MREIMADLGPISLGRFLPSDFDDVHAFASDPVVCRYQAWGPNTLQDTRAFLDDALIISDETHQLAVVKGQKVVGSAAAWITSASDENGEIGYTLHPDVWGRGYGTLVADALAQHAFTHLGCARVAATCRPGNIGSVRVLEKAGFRQEGYLRSAVVIRGERQDSLIFGRLAAD